CSRIFPPRTFRALQATWHRNYSLESRATKSPISSRFGVTVYRMFTAAYPFGEIEPFSQPRFGKPSPLSRYRPDLPAWLDAVVGKALNADPTQRFGDVIEFAHELENGATWAGPAG